MKAYPELGYEPKRVFDAFQAVRTFIESGLVCIRGPGVVHLALLLRATYRIQSLYRPCTCESLHEPAKALAPRAAGDQR